MQVNNKIPKLEDLFKIAECINKNGLNCEDITVNIKVKTPQLLNKLNEEFFFKNVKEDNESECPQSVDEIVLNINNITFKYTLPNDI